VRVIAYEDLQCSDCAVYHRMLQEQLLPAYGEFVAFEYRDFPLPKHAWARAAAIVARHFMNMTPKLGDAFRAYCYEHQREISSDDLTDHVRTFATASASSVEDAVNALNDAAVGQQVDADYKEGLARGVVRTPTVFIGNEAFIETFSFHDIARSIELALQSTGASSK
jgi:protein-disulfide isomerase